MSRVPSPYAIETRKHGATNTKGARMSARCNDRRISVPYNHALDMTGNHSAAAYEMARRMDRGDAMLIGATLPNGAMAWIENGKTVSDYVERGERDVLAKALREVLPYAESRAEDMEESAQEVEGSSGFSPEAQEDERRNADDAAAAVDAARAALALVGG